MRLEGKRIVITGGANGLGAEYVRAVHNEGSLVAIIDVDIASGSALASELGSRCVFIEGDVTKVQSVRNGLAVINERFGGIDVLINNAGIYPHKHFEDIELDDWHAVMRTNLDSVFICCKEVVEYLKAAGGGKIINIVTNLIWIMAPDMAHYIASKAGVLGFTRGIARELGLYGITVNALAPGANMPLEEMGTVGIQKMKEIIAFQVLKRPQLSCDLTGPIVFLCSTDSDFMSGQVICVDGGIAVR